jgi:hypothetical protein
MLSVLMRKGAETMPSPTKKLRVIRKRKDAPSKANRKADEKRVQKNREVLRELSSGDGK